MKGLSADVILVSSFVSGLVGLCPVSVEDLPESWAELPQQDFIAERLQARSGGPLAVDNASFVSKSFTY
jgi:hypothetical protein